MTAHDLDWEESSIRFAEWIKTEEAQEVFSGTKHEIQTESDAFREMTTITHEDLHIPFTI